MNALRVAVLLEAAAAAAGSHSHHYGKHEAPLTSTFQLSPSGSAGRTLSPRLFGCNFEGYLRGVGSALANYSDSETPSPAAAALATVLRDSGCKTLRFPGGTPAQTYMVDSAASGMRSGGVEATTLVKETALNFTGHGAGCFTPGSWSHKFYVRIVDFLKFAEDFGFEPLWQVNPTFYSDPLDGKIHAATLTAWVVKDGPTFCNRSGTQFRDRSLLITSDSRNGDRFVIDANLTAAAARASAVLGSQLEALEARGVALPRLFEVGNEDFAHFNYCGGPYVRSDTDDATRYARLAATLARTIRSHVAGADVIVTEIHNTLTNSTTLSVLEKQGSLGDVYAATAHYPFKAWPGIKGWSKPNVLPKKPMNLSAFVGTDVNFVGNSLVTSPLQAMYGKPLTTTETSTFKYKWGWDANTLSASLAGALQFARDWGQLVHETNETVAVRHDFESPWYGVAFFNVIWDDHAQSFSWMREGWREQPHATEAEMAALRKEWFEPALSNSTDPHKVSAQDVHEGQWWQSPTATAMRWLARCGNETARPVEVSPGSNTGGQNGRFGGLATFACQQDDVLALTVVNTDPVMHNVSLASNELQIARQIVLVTTLMGSADLGLATREGMTRSSQIVAGHSKDSFAKTVFATFAVPGYAMQRLEIDLSKSGYDLAAGTTLERPK
jgi:hypothetical protein